MKPQTMKVYKYLQAYGSITPVEAMQELSCSRLAARINDLREAGINIKTQTAHGLNKFGEKVHFARYTLNEQQS